LRESFKTATWVLAEIGTGRSQPEVTMACSLPTTDKRYKNSATGGPPFLPMIARAAMESKEKELIDLEPTPSFKRGWAGPVAGKMAAATLQVAAAILKGSIRQC
jgi:hypothetical protein